MRGQKLKSSKFAKDLRTFQTEAENRFWMQVRDRRFEGLKFRRQVPLGDYIVDFVCFEEKLIVEIDGGQHNESREDAVRDESFIARGYGVKRYWNNEVMTNIEGVMMDLQMELKRTLTPSLSLKGRGGRREEKNSPLPLRERI